MIDWPQVVTELHRIGIADEAIAKSLGVSRARVRGWNQYRHEPRHSDGEALLDLWCERTANMRESAPRSEDNRPLKLQTLNKELSGV
jgi:hypothetical protein